MASPQEIANLLAAAASAKSQGSTPAPAHHLEMDPVTITGKAFCPTCGKEMPQQGLPEPYPIKGDKGK